MLDARGAARGFGPGAVALAATGSFAHREHARRNPRTSTLWVLPHASHGGATDADPAGYEHRVIRFLDRALAPRVSG